MIMRKPAVTMPAPLPDNAPSQQPEALLSLPPRRRCQSKSGYGNCWLFAKHPGDHMVPIIVGWLNDPNDLWFGYTRRTQEPLGYILVKHGELP